jgi:hypothetical protein
MSRGFANFVFGDLHKKKTPQIGVALIDGSVDIITLDMVMRSYIKPESVYFEENGRED